MATRRPKQSWKSHPTTRIKPSRTLVCHPHPGSVSNAYPLENPNCASCDRPLEEVGYGVTVQTFERRPVADADAPKLVDSQQFRFKSSRWARIGRLRVEHIYFCQQCAERTEVLVVTPTTKVRLFRTVQTEGGLT